MRLLKHTIENCADSENEAKELIEKYRQDAKTEGYIIGSAGYTYKTKKAKGEIIGEVWVVKVVQIFGSLWEGLE